MPIMQLKPIIRITRNMLIWMMFIPSPSNSKKCVPVGCIIATSFEAPSNLVLDDPILKSVCALSRPRCE